MARQSRQEALSSDTGWYEGRLLATLVSGENPDGTAFLLPTESFVDWATRQGYVRNIFSGEIAIPAAGETNVIDLTVPAGETWYRKISWYSVVGAVSGRFRLYETPAGGIEAQQSRVVIPTGQSMELSANQKLNAGDRFRIAVMSATGAVATDTVSIRTNIIALPWVE